MAEAKKTNEMANGLGINVTDLLDVNNRLKEFRKRAELRKHELENWVMIEETSDVLDFISTKLRSDVDCNLELWMIKGMWKFLTSLLADEINDSTVFNVIDNITKGIKMYKNMFMNSNANSSKCVKHKLDSDDEDNNDNNNVFITVKSKSKKLKDNKNVNNAPSVVQTSNSFAVLENAMDTDTVNNVNNDIVNNTNVSESTNQSNRKKRIDPFWVQKDKEFEWRKIVAKINEQLKTELPLMDSGKFVKIYPQNVEQFRTVQSILISNNIKSFAISPQGTKPFKVIIKGIPSEIPVEEVKNELIQSGFEVMKVAQLRRFRDKSPLPIFQVHLAQNEYNKKVYSIKNFLNFMVVVEAYKFRGVKQCYNCLHFNHSSELCTLDPKCLKCAGNHKTNLCTKSVDDKCKCANCNGEHPANYKGCPMHPLSIKARNKELKIIKDLGKGDLSANVNSTITSEVINNTQGNVNSVKSFAQVAKSNIVSESAMNSVNSNVTDSISDNNNVNAGNDVEIEMNSVNNSNDNVNTNLNCNLKISDLNVENNSQNLIASLEQLMQIEKILTNICMLCEKLDRSETAKALGISNMLANQFGSIAKNIPH